MSIDPKDKELIATFANALEIAQQHAESLRGVSIATECQNRNLNMLLNIAGGVDGLAGARLTLVGPDGQEAEQLFEIIGAPTVGGVQ